MLDLFDLDETFSSEKVRLAQLTNKCKFATWKGKQGFLKFMVFIVKGTECSTYRYR